jgi:metallo-beta-lactamase family protein
MGNVSFQSFGAAGMVTGSKHLITTPKGSNILLDCGLVQGYGKDKAKLNLHLGFDPRKISAVVLSHAHIDHSGQLPKLVKEGYSGKIYATQATIDLVRIMLEDSAHIQFDDLKFINKRRLKEGLTKIEPLYDVKDVQATLGLFEPIGYKNKTWIAEDVILELTDAGHLLGSATVHLDIQNETESESSKITFTGDIGRYNMSILRNPDSFRQCDYLICESTYGDRLHDSQPEAEQKVLEIVLKTCVKNRGKLIIPSFSVGRTQAFVYALERFSNLNLLPPIKIFVDSPLSVKATEVIRKHKECFDQETIDNLKMDKELFEFDNLHYITEADESKKLNTYDQPCIIISSSGMAEAGRIKHHIKNNILDKRNTIMLIGYCSPESLGGRLKKGNKKVKIFGDWYSVNAEILSFESYSSHADYKEIFQFLSCQDFSKVKKIFLVHGEDKTLSNFKQKFQEKGYSDVIIPKRNEVFNL